MPKRNRTSLKYSSSLIQVIFPLCKEKVCFSQCLLARQILVNNREINIKTGKSGDSGDGVHGGGDARAAAPLVPTLLHTTKGWASLSHAPSPQPVLLKNWMHGSPGSPWSAACACGMGLWIGVAVFGWVMPVEEGRLGFLSPCCWSGPREYVYESWENGQHAFRSPGHASEMWVGGCLQGQSQQ